MSNGSKISKLRGILIWVLIATTVILPLVAAANSPLIAWRDAVYIGSGFAGILAMSLLFLQPLAIMNYLPGLIPRKSRIVHSWIGAGILFAVIIHVGGLWITSPPDVIDALLFASPTSFSIWGVIAMWVVLITAFLAILKRPLRLRPSHWRIAHIALAAIIIASTIAHALLIEGTMAVWSKWILSALLILAALRVFSKYAMPKKRN